MTGKEPAAHFHAAGSSACHGTPDDLSRLLAGLLLDLLRFGDRHAAAFPNVGVERIDCPTPQ
jgi:hypothetical protein